MRYSYEFKRKCVEVYRQGKWAETPKDVLQKIFHDTFLFSFVLRLLIL